MRNNLTRLKRVANWFEKNVSYKFLANVTVVVLVFATFQYIATSFSMISLRNKIIRLETELARADEVRQTLTKKITVVKKDKLSIPKTNVTCDKKDVPMCYINKNPLNVKALGKHDKWKGQIGKDRFGHAKFANWEDGIRAAAIVLKNYALKHSIDTIEGIVKRFAEGNQNEYMSFLEKRLNIKRDEKFDLLKRLPEVLKAMSKFESGMEIPDHMFSPYDLVVILAENTPKKRN